MNESIIFVPVTQVFWMRLWLIMNTFRDTRFLRFTRKMFNYTCVTVTSRWRKRDDSPLDVWREVRPETLRRCLHRSRFSLVTKVHSSLPLLTVKTWPNSMTNTLLCQPVSMTLILLIYSTKIIKKIKYHYLVPYTNVYDHHYCWIVNRRQLLPKKKAQLCRKLACHEFSADE